MLRTPPYRVETERLVLRCWEPTDAPRLKEAVDASVEHLRPWMPWAADEPQSLAQKTELLRGFRARFDRDEDYVYGLFARDGSGVVGGSGLHPRVGDDALEIGYWLRVERVGEGLATEAAAALTRVALEHCGADRVEIRVEPENAASRRVPEKLGYREEATLRRRLPPRGGDPRPRDVVVYVLFADELAGTPSARAVLAAYDAVGSRLP